MNVLLMVAIVVIGTIAQPSLAARHTPLTATIISYEIPLSNIMFEGVINRPQRCQQRGEICNDYLKCCPDIVCYTRGTCGDLV